ncbi:diaminopimelate epimerase [Flavobacterium sp. NKUCC04_CG]|uniref:diaminopimelate epimerase n=1 Tax=Flavobacterium sp. NKUCC04_CG TaxID=2842121 RepID=UPI001C5B734A|nr:diaminopimelate epimerase [Flavobacterium sp. NKUCC04_CG]MBW3520460.1 diaminopimelate epimerase [Flavobacterium sp. NKUCC04_CG]
MNTTVNFFKYHGTGNDFIMVDNRDETFPKSNRELIENMCDRRFGIGADGLILIERDAESDFKMRYFNADGNQSSMCGNGGRCIVAFAKQLGIIGDSCHFNAVDGLHYATINKENEVSLQMTNVGEIQSQGDYTYLNTGSPHHVVMVSDLEHYDVFHKGKEIRESVLYQPGGTNVNFVEKINQDTFAIRTFERGVEDETWSCGTGATAVAIAMFSNGETTATDINILVKGGRLNVKFTKEKAGYNSVFLTGAAQRVFDGTISVVL